MSTKQKNLLEKTLFVLLVVACVHIIPQSITLAQEPFPTRPVTIWCGFPAGGATDMVIRALAAGSEKSLGQKIIVINKPGTGGAVCASQLAKVKPDGYTLAGFPDTPNVRSPHLIDLDFDPLQDFTFIVGFGCWKDAFLVRADSPFQKWEDVVDWAKKNPGQLVYGFPGVTTTPQLRMIKIAQKEGFTLKYVPFAGDSPVVSALLGGHIMVAGGSSSGYRSHVEAKTLRILLVGEEEGLDYAPDAPTFKKMHYDFEFPKSVVVCAPKGLPDPIREVLEKSFIEGMKQEIFKKAAKFQEVFWMEPLTGRALTDFLKKSYSIYEQLIKEAGMYKIERK